MRSSVGLLVAAVAALGAVAAAFPLLRPLERAVPGLGRGTIEVLLTATVLAAAVIVLILTIRGLHRYHGAALRLRVAAAVIAGLATFGAWSFATTALATGARAFWLPTALSYGILVLLAGLAVRDLGRHRPSARWVVAVLVLVLPPIGLIVWLALRTVHLREVTTPRTG